MSKQNNASKDTSIDISSLSQFQSTIKQCHINIDVEVLVVNDEKVKLWLIENWKNVERKRYLLTPLCTLLTIILALVTASFNKMVLYIPGSFWSAFFVFCGLASLAWLVYEISRFRKSVSIDDMVVQLKNKSIPMKGTSKYYDTQDSPIINIKSGDNVVLSDHVNVEVVGPVQAELSKQKEDEELSIAKERIQIYLKEKLKRMGFDRIREMIDESYTDDFLKKLLKKYPKVFRKCPKKSNGKPLITLTRDESQDT